MHPSAPKGSGNAWCGHWAEVFAEDANEATCLRCEDERRRAVERCAGVSSSVLIDRALRRLIRTNGTHRDRIVAIALLFDLRRSEIEALCERLGIDLGGGEG